MPGDPLIPEPLHVTTRAITISADPEMIWPWLAQMGYRRGGLYSYDWLDRLFGVLDRPSAKTTLPRFQDLHAGDTIPLGAGPGWPVAAAEPKRTLLIHVRQGDVHVTWVFSLRAAGRGATRLVTRVRASAASGWWRRLQLKVLEPLEFLMVRRMLIGIKTRAEGLYARPGSSFPRIPSLLGRPL
jgi:hypothetical protein